jgi:hypothetical protein
MRPIPSKTLHTYDQKEIDLVEEWGGALYGYAFKWQGPMRQVTRREFLNAYPNAQVEVITREGFQDFIG